MNRIKTTLSELKAQGKKALVTYIVCGDPEPGATVNAMHTLVKGGANIIELGVPFSDPMAEGIVIQKGHERALALGTSLKSTLACVTEFRKQDSTTPIVLMGYANPVERMGHQVFADAAQQAGVDGLLTVDLPPEESKVLDEKLREVDIQNIYLIAPTTSPERTALICSAARGFVYYVSVKGVTGSAILDVDEITQKVSSITQYTDTPVMVGFGIKDAESAKAIGQVSDGVIVGSAFVKIMGQQGKSLSAINTELLNLVQSIRTALDEL